MTIPSAILSLLLTLLLSASGSVQLKAWNASNTTRLMYEQDKQTIDVAKGKALTVIDIYDNMICLMNIHVRSIITHQGPLQNIFHIGNNKKDQNYPSIFIDKNPNNGFKIRLTNSHMSRNTFSTHSPIQVNTTYRIKIQYTQTSFAMEFNGMPLFFDPKFGNHVLKTDKVVYVSNPWHSAADAQITDLHIYGWNNPDPQDINIDHVHISHSLESTHSDLESTTLNQILDHFSAPWIVVSLLGVILLTTVVCLSYVNYQKLAQYRDSVAIPGQFEGKRTLKASTSEVIKYKIKRMQNDAAHLDMEQFDLNAPSIQNEPIALEWCDEFYGVEPMEFPDMIPGEDIVTPI
eukprot:263072_1